MLPNEVLWELHKYVQKYAPQEGEKKEPVRAAPAAAPAAGARPKKNKPMGKVEQETRIQQLQSTLNNMHAQHGAAAGQAAVTASSPEDCKHSIPLYHRCLLGAVKPSCLMLIFFLQLLFSRPTRVETRTVTRVRRSEAFMRSIRGFVVSLIFRAVEDGNRTVGGNAFEGRRIDLPDMGSSMSSALRLCIQRLEQSTWWIDGLITHDDLR